MSISTVKSTGADDLASRAAQTLVEQIGKEMRARGVCALGIVGGRSVPAVLTALKPLLGDLKGELHVLWLDERVQGEKNYTDALPLLLKLRTTALHVFAHPLKTGTREDITKEAARVMETLKRVRGELKLDLVLASAGEDGHVASLFPRNAGLKAVGVGYAIVTDAPKDPPVRITVTPSLLLTARFGVLLFSGGEKRMAYTHFLDTSIPTKECPAKLLLGLPELVVVTALGR